MCPVRMDFLTMTYFKQTTRSILTQREKNETIATVNQAMIYLSERDRSFKMPDFESIDDAPRSFSYSQNVMPYMSRMVILIKGNTQSKRFYRNRRTAQICWESILIAEEMSSDLS